jgi:hypothetical protein
MTYEGLALADRQILEVMSVARDTGAFCRADRNQPCQDLWPLSTQGYDRRGFRCRPRYLGSEVTLTHALLKDGSDYTPYEGLEVIGWPELTMVRGRCIVNDGKLLGTIGFGEFIRREVRA